MARDSNGRVSKSIVRTMVRLSVCHVDIQWRWGYNRAGTVGQVHGMASDGKIQR